MRKELVNFTIGGFGYVFLVVDDYGTPRALKQINASSREQMDNAKNEIRIMVRIGTILKI